MHAESNSARAPVARTAFRISLAIQAAALFVLVFGDIGFDRPGRFGLDFGHFLILVGTWTAAAGVGFFAAFRQRQTGAFVLQLAAVIPPIAWVMAH